MRGICPPPASRPGRAHGRSPSTWNCLRRPAEPEPAEVAVRLAQRHLRQQFADAGGMLEAVARAGRGDDDAVELGMAVDDEARVLHPGVEADLVAYAGRRQAGEKGR